MPKPKNFKSHDKPTVSIIGAGRLGTALGLALNSAGYPIVSLVARRRQRARKAARLLDVPLEVLAAEDLHRYQPSDLVLVAVPDDRIAEVAEALGTLETVTRPFVLHTSGALSSAVFANVAKKGWHTGSIHPLASVSDPVAGVEALRNAYWCIEGDAMATRLARRIVRDLGARSFSIQSKDKPLYHAAAVMTSGHVTALFDIALDMLENCGIPRRKARQILFPLLDSTAANLSRAEPAKALTGTFARGDITTLKLHLEALKAKNLEEALKLYLLLGSHSLKLARHKIPADIFAEIRKRLR
jgi:predicted short-subunit dehydrogenase-like oxidoreductase (DUF2520 family)